MTRRRAETAVEDLQEGERRLRELVERGFSEMEAEALLAAGQTYWGTSDLLEGDGTAQQKRIPAVEAEPGPSPAPSFPLAVSEPMQACLREVGVAAAKMDAALYRSTRHVFLRVRETKGKEAGGLKALQQLEDLVRKQQAVFPVRAWGYAPSVPDGQSFLHAACTKDEPEVVAAVLLGMVAATCTDVPARVGDSAALTTPTHEQSQAPGTCKIQAARAMVLEGLRLSAGAEYSRLPPHEQRLGWPAAAVTLLKSVDMVGRTPLHLAAEHGQLLTVKLLLSLSRVLLEHSPIGPSAPVDNAGRTPFACFAQSQACRALMQRDPGRVTELQDLLVRAGDPSILPAVLPPPQSGHAPETPPNPLHGPRAASEGSEEALVRFPYLVVRREHPLLLATNPVLQSLVWGAYAAPGWRGSMEDCICILEDMRLPNNIPYSVFAVFDGHAGNTVSELATNRLRECLTAAAAQVHPAMRTVDGSMEVLLATMIKEALVALEALILEHCGAKNCNAGSTLALVLLTEDLIALANIGDSRAVLYESDGRGGEWSVRATTHDHKPSSTDEHRRITASGGRVKNGRLDVPGKLAVSRALGDLPAKRAEPPVLIAEPSIQILSRQPVRDEMVIIASDGVWDVKSNDEASQFIRQGLERSSGNGPATLAMGVVAEELATECLRSTDNTSCVVLRLMG
mmetsp:Transcript_17961/g.52515  ORF Transcript_17961/g.52515 Transcript_17961/m.52515 type:complete len:682 (-) Transcript_17961:8-2053(-)